MFLGSVATRIVNECRAVNNVTYETTLKLLARDRVGVGGMRYLYFARTMCVARGVGTCSTVR